MEALTDLKVIMHSKRANICYLEKCKVLVKDGRVLYLTEAKKENCYWNIPVANTTVILLGIGTSITQAAVRMLASASVLIGFTGDGGTPLIAGNEIEWISPQNEYRPTQFLQSWMAFWFDENKRLEIAKGFQQARISFIERVWTQDRALKAENFYLDDFKFSRDLKNFKDSIPSCQCVNDLMLAEARFTKALYKFAANTTNHTGFNRNPDGGDQANSFLNYGNYLAYGLAATTLWVLGIPHGLAVMHGKTRRGALVFDVADLIKDALILPWAFISAKEKETEKRFRIQCLKNFADHKALDFMFESVESFALKGAQL